MIDTNPPTAEELEQLLAKHAHRFPTKASFTVEGDRGAEQVLRLVLGNPTGACALPADEKASPVWDRLVESMLATGVSATSAPERVVADCILWPSADVYATWRARWPAIAGDIMYGVFRKIGLGITAMTIPGDADKAPAPIAEALEADPRACWRRLAPHGAAYDVVIAPPTPVRHDAFAKALRSPGAKSGELVRDLAEAQVKVIVEGEKVVKASDVFDRFPGLAVQVAVRARHMVEALRDVQLGEW